MRILRSAQTKVCVDGSLMKEYVLDEPLTPGFLAFLEHFGTVRTMEQLKKPYFSFEQERFISIRGFTGDCSVEVRYSREHADLVGDYFHLLLFYYPGGEPGIARLRGIGESIRARMKVRQDPATGHPV